ncbi:hypothetical protein M0R36_11235 [bacterium]|jgi:hypothetical protein|nr:hypothetical protein [bacterium]
MNKNVDKNRIVLLGNERDTHGQNVNEFIVVEGLLITRWVDGKPMIVMELEEREGYGYCTALRPLEGFGAISVHITPDRAEECLKFRNIEPAISRTEFDGLLESESY